MFQNYLKIAFRNFLKDKLFSAINVLGLATGLAACIMIILYVQDELSFDKFVPGSENIYKIQAIFTPPGRVTPIYNAYGPARAHDELRNEIPGILDTARVFQSAMTVRRGDVLFYENVSYTSANYFSFFGLDLVAGEAETVLSDNSSVVLSEKMARKYFGDENPVGQTLTMDTRRGLRDYRVTGVARDLPQNSHMTFDMAIWFDREEWADNPNWAERWVAANMMVYMQLPAGSDPAEIEAQFPGVIDRLATPEVLSFNVPVDSATEIVTWNLINLEDVHLYGYRNGAFKPGGSVATILTFSAVAVLILLIGVLNFVNLSTARSLRRAREVSLRKVVGAARRQLVAQFIGESVLLTTVALTIAIAAVELLLPSYNEFLSKSMALDLTDNGILVIGLIGLAVIAGPLGGLYPAFYISSFRPAHILKANQSGASGSARLRSALVVVQFSISIGLIVATSIVYNQMDFARTVDLGYDRENVLIIDGVRNNAVFPSRFALKDRLLDHTGITAAAFSLGAPSIPSGAGTRGFQEDNPEPVIMIMRQVDHDFFSTYAIEPLAGRLFSRDFGTDVIRDRDLPGYRNGSIILNATAVRQYGWSSPEDAIGRTIRLLVDISDETAEVEGTIVGVVPDVQYGSLRDTVNPDVFFIDEQFYSALSIRFRATELSGVLAHINSTWSDIAPDVPISFNFLDENLESQYQSDIAAGKMFAVFAILAVLVSSLGLYGLAAFAAERRTREIGIRKILGARVMDIVRLMLFQFSAPVLIANLIAWPVAGYFMNQWLQGFAYRIDLPFLPFIVAGLIALFIAWITVAGHAIRVARANPIHALRYE